MEATTLRQLYDRLGDILKKGDDIFIREGPLLLKDYFENGHLKGLQSRPASTGYTRKKVMGDQGKHVIRFMEWSPGFSIFPHEHHGRPCFEFLVSGNLIVSDFLPAQNGKNEFTLELLKTHVVNPGQFAIVDPRITQVHSVFSPVRSRSLHVYPEDNYFTMGYIHNGDDTYQRREFDLKDD